MTQIELAKNGIVPPQVKHVAEKEGAGIDSILQGLIEGTIVIPANPNHKNLIPYGIGKRLKTKVNANIGTSSDFCNLDTELKKVRAAIDSGSDTIMDLSTGGDISAIRRAIIACSTVPIGTVPIYQAGIEAIAKHGTIVNMTTDEIFAVIEEQAKDGVDFMTVHCSVTQTSVARLKSQGRTTGIVSRGGAFITGWMLDQIASNVQLEKSLCHKAPFYVLGPLVTDVGAGYDHITGAIGGAVAAAAGADFLCYVTPAEHLSLPDTEDVKQGVIASRIAAHAGDIVKGIKGAKEWDGEMSRARKNLDWATQAKLSLDPELSQQVHSKIPTSEKTCSMCGKYCAMAIVEKYLGKS